MTIRPQAMFRRPVENASWTRSAAHVIAAYARACGTPPHAPGRSGTGNGPIDHAMTPTRIRSAGTEALRRGRPSERSSSWTTTFVNHASGRSPQG